MRSLFSCVNIYCCGVLDDDLIALNLKVHEVYVLKLKKKLQFEEKRESDQRRVIDFFSNQFS